MAEQVTTTDHKKIKSFAEEHNLQPARLAGTNQESQGLIRLMEKQNTRHTEQNKLEEISWNAWFEAFENNDLALIYERGTGSDFNKLVSRN